MSASRSAISAVELLVAAGQGSQGDLGGGVRGGRRRCGRVAALAQVRDQLLGRSGRAAGRAASGAVTIRVLIWRWVSARWSTALRRATRRLRRASTRPSRCLGMPVATPARAALAAASASIGSDLPCEPAGLAVGPVDLDHRDARRSQVAGQAGAVGAGALDPDQYARAEPAHPGQQGAVAGRGGGELLRCPARRPVGSIAAAVWVSRWVSTPPMTSTRLASRGSGVVVRVCHRGGLSVLSSVGRAGRHAPAGRADKTVMGASGTGSYEVTTPRPVSARAPRDRTDRSG